MGVPEDVLTLEEILSRDRVPGKNQTGYESREGEYGVSTGERWWFVLYSWRCGSPSEEEVVEQEFRGAGSLACARAVGDGDVVSSAHSGGVANGFTCAQGYSNGDAVGQVKWSGARGEPGAPAEVVEQLPPVGIWGTVTSELLRVLPSV